MKTRADKIFKRIKNNKLVAVIIVVVAIVIAVANFKNALRELGLPLFRQKKESSTLQEILDQLKRAPAPTQVSYQPLPQKLQERFDQEMQNLVKQHFVIAPNILTYQVEESTAIKLPSMLLVTQGLRYAVIACGNASIHGLQATMFDEDGNLLDSDEGDRKVVVKTSSDYTGTAEAFIQVKDVDGVGQINIATARRAPPEPSQSPRGLGWEPTFHTETGSPEASPQP